MKKEFKEIINKFYEINKKGYIKGINENLNNSCGMTLESLLNKNPDSMFFPDYNGIEIKTTQRFSHYPVSLLSIAFDGPAPFECNYILERYGKKDFKFKDKKTLLTSLEINKKILVNYKYYFELIIDNEHKRLAINIYDKNNNFIEQRGFLDFKLIESRLNIKLNKLALIYASKKSEIDGLYFRYYKIRCLLFKNFNTFLKLLDNGFIKVSLQLRIARSGDSSGKQKNKGLIFSIEKDNINMLFDEVFSYEK